jgi:hypothetical protein
MNSINNKTTQINARSAVEIIRPKSKLVKMPKIFENFIKILNLKIK